MQCATHPGVETELRCREHGLIPTPPIYRMTPAVAAATAAVGTVVGGSLLARLWHGFPPVSAGDLLQGILAVPLLWVFGAPRLLGRRGRWSDQYCLYAAST